MNLSNLIHEINKIFIKELGDKLFDEYIDLVKKSLIIKMSDKNIILQKINEIYKKRININKSSIIKNIIFNVKEQIRNQNNKHNQRKMSNFKQSIYLREIEIIIQYLIENSENSGKIPDFISILLYVAKQRKIIEVLKLNENYWMFGLLRTETRDIKNSRDEIRLRSPIQASRGDHLINELATGRNISTNELSKLPLNNHAFKYNGIKLTSLNVSLWRKNRRYSASWIHTKAIYIYPLLLKMNELYDRFISSNVKSKRLLSKLYWVYMQTCPFQRGSSSIGEIIFSALLQKYFNCDFKLYKEEVIPEIIPDIHALSYDLKKFQDIFWERFTTCPINNRNNNNQHSNVPTNFFDN